MDAELEIDNIQRLFSAIQQSGKIKKHIDFFNWLQNSVAEFIPLDALLVVWGNFSDGAEHAKLQYDACSNVNGVNNCALRSASKEVNQCMVYLYELWLDHHRHLYALNNIAASEFDCKLRRVFPDFPQALNSLLVYGISDARTGNDCLYVFFSKQNKFQIKHSALDLLIPHMDHALRKVQHVEPAKALVKSSVPINIAALTQRELEVVEWIRVGKTNEEVAAILNITQNTVKSHLKRIYQKLNVSKRAQAVALLASH